MNPFSLVAVGDRLYVTDGGQNLIWRVDLSAREFSVLTRFANVPNPQFNPNPPPPSMGGPFLEAVPTGIRFSDGQLLVTLFRGFPFPAGASTVMRVESAQPLQDPVLTLHDANGAEIMRNDSWKGDSGQTSQQAEIEASGLAPTNDAESALIATLTPGNYTGVVSGKDDRSGVALVEVYHVQ